MNCVTADLQTEMATLWRREIHRLVEQIHAFPEDQGLWETRPGVTNSAGNLTLHLIGNLRTYIGRDLGGIPYERRRDLEFSERNLSRQELAAQVALLEKYIPQIVAGLMPDVLDQPFPELYQGELISTRQFLLHLLGHFNYHLGQIDYVRRMIAGGGALPPGLTAIRNERPSVE
jgi:hypothetical protein